MATATCAKARTSAAASSSDAPARPARSNGMTVRFGPALLRRLTTEVVGRRRELEAIVAALAAGRHLLLEGPPGTGKSTVLRPIAAAADSGSEFVERSGERRVWKEGGRTRRSRGSRNQN